jgi:hypothetical protein
MDPEKSAGPQKVNFSKERFSTGGRSAGGSGRVTIGGQSAWGRIKDWTASVCDANANGRGLWVRPMRRGHAARTVLLAAGFVADYTPFKFSRAVTLMRRLAPAACVRWRSRGLQRERKEASGEREQQKQSGGQALHVSVSQ